MVILNKITSYMPVVVFLSLALSAVLLHNTARANYPADVTEECVGDSVVCFSWEVPTQRVNGSSLLPSEIYGYKIYEQGDPVHTVVGGDVTSYNYDFGGYGYSCWTISTIDDYGQEGPQSEEYCGDVKPPAPGAPSLTISFGI